MLCRVRVASDEELAAMHSQKANPKNAVVSHVTEYRAMEGQGFEKTRESRGITWDVNIMSVVMDK